MDINASNWNEDDNSNTTAAPSGAPEGMAPSGINNVLRAHQGAVKRFWNKINAVKTTAGTTSAYTLTYDVAPAAYTDGEIISFVVNAANAAAATINVNTLGAKPLRLFGGNLLAGALIADQIVMARYSSSAGAFDIIPQHGMVRLGSANPSAASAVDFTGIPAAVNHLFCEFEFRPATDAVSFAIQTYDAAGNLDTGGSDYYYTGFAFDSSGGSGIFGSGADTAVLLSNGSLIDNGTTAFGGDFTASNIQAATFTKFNFRTTYLHSSGSVQVGVTGNGGRAEADRITGIRFRVSSGTFTGRTTLYASA